jgi:sensor histidine kinase YesM
MRWPEARLVAVVLVAWTLEGIGTAGSLMTMAGSSWGRALTVSLASAWMWVPLTLALFAVVAWRPLDRDRWPSTLLLHAAAVAGVCIARAGLVMALNRWVGWYADLPAFDDVVLTSVANNLLLACLQLGIGHALVLARRDAERRRQTDELRAALAEARLATLEGQLRPHFLFNALNSIAELVHRDRDAAERAVLDLAELLRESLRERGQEVALADELRLATAYLAIEKLRLGDRLDLAWSVAADARAARVPRLLLQPLVENAIRHGVALRQTPGRLSIGAERRGARLVVTVDNDGPGPGADVSAEPHGLGLRATRARLAHLYGDDQSLALEPTATGTRAVVTVPFR